MSETPSNFLTGKWAKLQWAWDATSLRALQYCPRYYELTILEGWRGEALDLEFGILVHSSMEEFARSRIAGASKQEAQLAALRVAIEQSGSRDEDGNWTPWGGIYMTMWRCEGTEPYKQGGRRVKCPHAKVGAWTPGEGPEVCGVCGSGTHTERVWIPGKKGKDRPALLRLVWAMTEETPEDYAGRPRPFAFPDGTPAVELPLRVPLPFQTPTGQPYILAGYLDEIEVEDAVPALDLPPSYDIVDYKTTAKTLGDGYFGQYAPNVQVSNYDLMASVAFPHLRINGVRIKAAQTLVGGVVTGSRTFSRTEGQREEFLREIGVWLKIAELYAEQDFWPKAEANCYICPLKRVCRLDPAKRQRELEENFTRSKWNPLTER